MTSSLHIHRAEPQHHLSSHHHYLHHENTCMCPCLTRIVSPCLYRPLVEVYLLYCASTVTARCSITSQKLQHNWDYCSGLQVYSDPLISHLPMPFSSSPCSNPDQFRVFAKAMGCLHILFLRINTGVAPHLALDPVLDCNSYRRLGSLFSLARDLFGILRSPTPGSGPPMCLLRYRQTTGCRLWFKGFPPLGSLCS
jgi:hypothetical protein